MRKLLVLAPLLTSLAALGCATDSDSNSDLGVATQALSSGVVDVTISLQNDWGSGYCTDVVISNRGAEAVSNWEVTLDYGGSSVGNLWNGNRSGTVVTPVAHNNTVAPGATQSFGFCANGSGRPTVMSVTFDGGGGGTGPTCSDGTQNQGESGVDCGGPCDACVPDPSCSDGEQNQGETAIDCGGPCPACPVEPTCDDGTQNQGETGVDCGGPCSACVPDPTCDDGEQNQGETGIDCGGPCSACAPDPTCDDGEQNQGETGVDCGGPCSACAPDPTCDDGEQNQGETGVDCGGPCNPCGGGGGSCDGLKTWVDNDWRLKFTAGEVVEFEGNRYRANSSIDYPNGSCTPGSAAGWCANWFTLLGACGAGGSDPTCNDGIQNQGESGVDCGGPCSACQVDPTCNDGIQNQGESGVDCGGPCSACQVDPTCNDGIQNQGESGVDCGGPCQACQSNATCSDGVQNQGETGVDCGGPCESCDATTCDGYATRYWDCCKAHCSWDQNVPMSVAPAAVCDANGGSVGSQTASSCDGGNGFQCQSFIPRAVTSNLSYGYAATSSGDVCGRCFEIEFTGQGHYGNDPGSAAIANKKMVVQALNIGHDVAGGQFDILIPGGGVGLFNACSNQWGVSNSELGAQYGGFLTQCKDQGGSHDQVKSCVRNKCSSVFGSRGLDEMQEGCEWFVDWYEAADNPNIRYREVSCPSELTGQSGMDRTALGDIQNSCN